MMQAPLELVGLGSSSSMDSFASWKINGSGMEKEESEQRVLCIYRHSWLQRTVANSTWEMKLTRIHERVVKAKIGRLRRESAWIVQALRGVNGSQFLMTFPSHTIDPSRKSEAPIAKTQTNLLLPLLLLLLLLLFLFNLFSFVFRCISMVENHH